MHCFKLHCIHLFSHVYEISYFGVIKFCYDLRGIYIAIMVTAIIIFYAFLLLHVYLLLFFSVSGLYAIVISDIDGVPVLKGD